MQLEEARQKATEYANDSVRPFLLMYKDSEFIAEAPIFQEAQEARGYTLYGVVYPQVPGVTDPVAYCAGFSLGQELGYALAHLEYNARRGFAEDAAWAKHLSTMLDVQLGVQNHSLWLEQLNGILQPAGLQPISAKSQWTPQMRNSNYLAGYLLGLDRGKAKYLEVLDLEGELQEEYWDFVSIGINPKRG